MVVAYAPFEDPIAHKPPSAMVVAQNFKGVVPISDNTECNYIVMGFILGIFVISLVDSMRN
jgi:hypothetical protein